LSQRDWVAPRAYFTSGPGNYTYQRIPLLLLHEWGQFQALYGHDISIYFFNGLQLSFKA
jgi:hypothetical protein